MPDAIRLQLLMGEVAATPVPASVAEALISVEVTTAVGTASGFQLTFAAGRRSPLTRQLLTAGFFAPKRRVVVLVTVTGTSTVLMDGVITRHDIAPSSEPGASTLTVTGEDLTALMDLDVRQQSYAGQDADVRVRAVLARYGQYGIQPQVASAVLPDVPNPVIRQPVQRATDLQYVEALARDVGYVFYLQPGPAAGSSTAYWGPELRTGTPQPALSVGFDADSTVDRLSFAFDGLRKTRYTRNGTPVATPQLDRLRPPLTTQPAEPLRSAPLPATAMLDDTASSLLASALAATSADNVTGHGELDVLRYGYVLAARALVGVRGAGGGYDGLFYVTSVTHTLTRSAYRQSFALTRDGLGALAATVPP